MKHVIWLGGPPGSGKTTIATRLARRYGLRLYSADEPGCTVTEHCVQEARLHTAGNR